MSRDQHLVSVDWLADHLSAPDVAIIDGSWYLPPMGRDPKAEYAEGHIPGAVYFDIDTIADTDTDLPHMLPRPERFASRMRKMGIGDGQRIVAYDGVGMFSAARIWWTFQVMGVDDVCVLDGGLPAWIAAGHALDDEKPQRIERHFSARRQAGLVYDKDDILGMIGNAGQIADARSAGRFAGTEPEPRPGLRGGHIPGSLNLPFDELLTPEGRLKDNAGLESAFQAAGIDWRKPIVSTCGSGVTAAIIALAAAILTGRTGAIYDGSWSEWGGDPALPIDTV